MYKRQVYLDAILAHGDGEFTAQWMQQTFERFWDYASAVVDWTNSMLLPPPPHLLQLLQAAGDAPDLAHAVANGFNHPPSFFPWWSDPAACEAFIAAKSPRAAA